MIAYINEIQQRFITDYGFKKGENGCPKDVPDGAYPMMVQERLDLVIVTNGKIWCCNFVGDADGLKQFQKDVIEKRNKK